MNNKIKLLETFGFKDEDLQYLDENLNNLLNEELSRKKPNSRLLDIFKKFIANNRYIDIWMAAYKAYTVNTDTLSWAYQRIFNIPSNNPEYEILRQMLEYDSKIKIWLSSFYTELNKLIYTIRLRHISAAEKLINRIVSEMALGKSLFLGFENVTKDYRTLIFQSKEPEPKTQVYYIE